MIKMGIFHEKPKPVRAFQWSGSEDEAIQVAGFLGEAVASFLGVGFENKAQGRHAHIALKTPERLQNAFPGDWFVEVDDSYWVIVPRESFDKRFVEVPVD